MNCKSNSSHASKLTRNRCVRAWSAGIKYGQSRYRPCFDEIQSCWCITLLRIIQTSRQSSRNRKTVTIQQYWMCTRVILDLFGGVNCQNSEMSLVARTMLLDHMTWSQKYSMPQRNYAKIVTWFSVREDSKREHTAIVTAMRKQTGFYKQTELNRTLACQMECMLWQREQIMITTGKKSDFKKNNFFYFKLIFWCFYIILMW